MSTKPLSYNKTQDESWHESKSGFWSKIDALDKVAPSIMFDLGPGPKFIPFNHNINVNKGSIPIIILFLMVYYNNFEFGMWIYFAMHSCYGIFWVAKDSIFPDKTHQGPQTICSAALVWLVAGPYYIFPWLLASRNANSSPNIERIVFALIVYICGTVLVMGADG